MTLLATSSARSFRGPAYCTLKPIDYDLFISLENDVFRYLTSSTRRGWNPRRESHSPSIGCLVEDETDGDARLPYSRVRSSPHERCAHARTLDIRARACRYTHRDNDDDDAMRAHLRAFTRTWERVWDRRADRVCRCARFFSPYVRCIQTARPSVLFLFLRLKRASSSNESERVSDRRRSFALLRVSRVIRDFSGNILFPVRVWSFTPSMSCDAHVFSLSPPLSLSRRLVKIKITFFMHLRRMLYNIWFIKFTYAPQQKVKIMSFWRHID